MKTISDPKHLDKILEYFGASEGSIDLIYGRIGNGKTYLATELIFEDLMNGKVVYCNWHISFDGFDERESRMHLLAGIFFMKGTYYKFPKENLHYFNSDDVDTEYLSNLTDCNVYIDEGQWIFDSYEGTKFSKAKRRLILHTRHLNRRLVIITQRPTAIQVSARGNVNRFFKCEKWKSWPFVVFRQWEYQDMVGETVDETKPVSRRVFFAKKRIFNAYNTRYLRGGIPISQKLYVEAYKLNYAEKISLFFKGMFGTRAVLKNAQVPNPAGSPTGGRIIESPFIDPPPKRSIRAVSKKSLGDRVSDTTIKNGERLNTVPVGKDETQPLF